MKWSEQAWQQADPIFQKIITMPFNLELMNGALATERFRFYMMQDAHYLQAFSKVLSILAAKMPAPEQTLAFIRFAEGAIVVERALHEGYFKQWGISDEGEMSPTCQLYTDFIYSRAILGNLEVGIAAVLPCFWVYKKVGDYIYANQIKGENPYQQWIDTYAGEEFGTIVQNAIDIADAVAATCSSIQQQKMTDVFVKATKLEWMFWDSAYRLEKWAV